MRFTACLTFLALASPAVCLLADDPAQKAALTDLFKSTGGDQWHNTQNWLGAGSYCFWSRVSCIDGTTDVEQM